MHLIEMVRTLDADISRLIRSQIADENSERFGGFLMENCHVEPRMSGFALSRLILGYICSESKHHLSKNTEKAIQATLAYMTRHQRPSGCFDLSSCNFDSPPDTAFMINAVLNAWWVMEKRNISEAGWLNDPLYRLIDSAATGIAAGGFHTPNHRWAIASCLLHCARITGRKELALRANQYLAEGLDINEDGEFAERSAGNYNQVNDDQMVRLYLATGDETYLLAARKNLEMIYYYIDPDESVFTNNSTRQDYGKKVYTESYYEYFLLVGFFLKEPQLGAMAEWICQTALKRGIIPPGVEWLLLYPEMDGYGATTPFKPPFVRYKKLFPASDIARYRDGDFSFTLMKNKPNFLYFQSGGLCLYMVIYANICDRRNFIAETLEEIPGGYLMAAHSPSWYYLPYGKNRPETSDWWKMDSAETREIVQGTPLNTLVEVFPTEIGADLHIKTTGIDQLPLRLEIGLPPRCLLRGEGFIKESRAGDAITLLSGSLEVSDANGDALSLSPVFGRHNWMGRSDRAYPQSLEHFTVYLTDYTPVDRFIHITARRFERKELP